MIDATADALSHAPAKRDAAPVAHDSHVERVTIAMRVSSEQLWLLSDGVPRCHLDVCVVTLAHVIRRVDAARSAALAVEARRCHQGLAAGSAWRSKKLQSTSLALALVAPAASAQAGANAMSEGQLWPKPWMR